MTLGLRILAAFPFACSKASVVADVACSNASIVMSAFRFIIALMS